MLGFWALVHREGRTFGISFPDVPGCVSSGGSLEEVLVEGREALSAHLALLKGEGEPIPAPRSHAELVARADEEWGAADGTWHLVQPRDVAAPKLRVNIMVNAGLLREADAAAEAAGTTRSALVEEALRQRLEAVPWGGRAPARAREHAPANRGAKRRIER